MTMLVILALLSHTSHNSNAFHGEFATLRLSQLQLPNPIDPFGSLDEPTDLLLPKVVAPRDHLGSSRSDTGFAGSARARDDQPLPLFGHILDGDKAFSVDFVIDCQGRFFRQVHPDGGRRNHLRPNGRRHSGLDIRVRENNFVCDGPRHDARVYYVGFAGESARVKVAGFHPGYGWHVVLSRTIDGRNIDTVFAHLRTLSVRPNEVIQPGTEIGVVGRSGVATGPHLHYEERQDGRSRRLANIARATF